MYTFNELPRKCIALHADSDAITEMATTVRSVASAVCTLHAQLLLDIRTVDGHFVGRLRVGAGWRQRWRHRQFYNIPQEGVWPISVCTQTN